MPIVEVPQGVVIHNCSRASVLEEISRKNQANSDTIVHSNDITIYGENTTDSPEYYLGNKFPGDGKQPVSFYVEAFAQLLNRLRIPVDFYNRNISIIQAMMFNYWKQQYNNSFLFRGTNNGSNVRAVLSSKYSTMDDHELFPVVFTAFNNNDVYIRTFGYDHHITRMLVTFPSTSVRYEANNLSTNLVGGAAITNSETGYAAAYIEPVVFDNSYAFYNRAHFGEYGALKPIIHKGDVDITRIYPLVARARQVAQVGIVQLAESMHQFVDTDHALNLAKKTGLPERYANILAEEWETEERISKFNIARRILQMAAELPLFKSMTIEQQVGNVVGLFHSNRSRMTQIAEELNQGA